MKENGYCAFCKSPKKFYSKSSRVFFHIVLALFLGVAFNYLWTLELDPRALFFSVIILFLLEMYQKFRWRLSVICHKCGFDPVLYIKDPSLACEKVKVRLEERQKNPLKNLFNPIKLPFRKT